MIPEILDLRMRQRRNMLATLLLSEGVPLLLGGDELARTQGGNNNAYCQDNAVSWVDWSTDADRQRAVRVRRLAVPPATRHPRPAPAALPAPG